MENESEKLSLIIEIFISGFTNKLIEITKTKNNILILADKSFLSSFKPTKNKKKIDYLKIIFEIFEEKPKIFSNDE